MVFPLVSAAAVALWVAAAAAAASCCERGVAWIAAVEESALSVLSTLLVVSGRLRLVAIDSMRELDDLMDVARVVGTEAGGVAVAVEADVVDAPTTKVVLGLEAAVVSDEAGAAAVVLSETAGFNATAVV